MSELALRTALVLTTAIGCFPVKYSEGLRAFEFRWCHPTVAYSVALLAFNVFSNLNFILNDLSALVHLSLGKSLAGNISGYIDVSNFMAGDIFIRLFAILYCSKTVELVKIMRELKTRMELLRLSYSSQEEEEEEEEQCWNEKIRPRQKLYREVLNLKKYTYGRMYLLLVVALAFHVININVRVGQVVGLSHESTIFRTFWRYPGAVWVFKSIFWLNNGLAIVSYIFGLSMVVLFGVQLLIIYHDLKTVLINGLLSVCSGMSSESIKSDGQGSLSEQLIESFKALRDAFNIYSELAGTYAIIQVTIACVALGQSLFQFSVKQELALFSHSVACFLWIYITASIGHCMEVQICEGSNNIKNAASLSRAFCKEQLRAITEIVMNWTWRFTAHNIFVFNRGLLLGCFQTVMTYMIFLFQLKLSEKNP